MKAEEMYVPGDDEMHDKGPRANAGRVHLQLVDPVSPPPWHDKLQAIPAMRSALVPLDEPDAVWSKPFSLIKADFEPWLSYYSGYRCSRLFLNSVPTGENEIEVDFPVRALLALKRLDVRLITEPAVQIDGPVEYFDASRAPVARRGSVGAIDSLALAADAMHRAQLRRAQERGRALGDQLHEALLGPGLANLIAAWQKVYRRLPSAHELHVMLTTGYVEPSEPVPSQGTFEEQEPAVAAAASLPQAATTPDAVRTTADESTRRWTGYLLHALGLAGAAGLVCLIALTS